MQPKLIAVTLLMAAGVLPGLAQHGDDKLVTVSHTQTLPFKPGGTVAIHHSYGQLTVEGWDRAEVEVTVTKMPDCLYDAKQRGDALQRAGRVQVKAESRSDGEIAIDTVLPPHSRLLHPFGFEVGVDLEYTIRVPRSTRLTIHHERGQILVSGVTADIEASGISGDIVVLLAANGKYAIDAKTDIGTVWTDFAGEAKWTGLAGAQYTLAETAPTQRLHLRQVEGGITIKQSPAEAQPPSAPLQ